MMTTKHDLRAAVLERANRADLEPLDLPTRELVRRAFAVADEMALQGRGLAHGAPAIVAVGMTGRNVLIGDGWANEHTPPPVPGLYARRVSDGAPWRWPEGTAEPTDEDRARDLEAAGPPVRVGPAGPATGELVDELARLADADPARVALPFRHLLTRAAHAWLTVRRVTRPGLATWAKWGTFGARGLHPNDLYQPKDDDVREGARALARWALSDAAAPRKDGNAGDEVASWVLGRGGDVLDRWTAEAAEVLPELAKRWPDADAWASSYALSHPWAADVYGLALATVDVPGVGAVLAADGMLADLLEALGDPERPDKVRRRSAARVAGWLAPERDLGLPGDPGKGPGSLYDAWWGGPVPEGCPVASPAIVSVLRAAWARFRPNVEREWRIAQRHPALTTNAVNATLDLLSRGTEMNRTDLALVSGAYPKEQVGWFDHDQLRLFHPLERTDAATDAATVDPVHFGEALAQLDSSRSGVPGVYALIHAVIAAHRSQGARAGSAEWPSWSAWAQEVADLSRVKLTPDLRRALYSIAALGHLVRFRLRDGRTQLGLWTLTAPNPFKRGRPPAGNSAAVIFTYAAPLRPDWSPQENVTDNRRGVRLMRVGPEILEIETPKDPEQRAPALHYSMALIADVTANGGGTDAGALVSPARRAALAERFKLRVDGEPAQLDNVLRGGFLVRVGPDRYRVAGPGAHLARYKRPFGKGSKGPGKR